ncbi:MAG: hypothetical protein HZA79_02285 [Sphingobacteriales bacterium]|nr:hypothetical protein [Sphingobacteriales bacterium]
MNPLQLAILAYLQQNALGIPNAKNSDTIYNAMVQQGLPVIAGRTQEHVRAAIRSMIKDHNQLIGTESGFNPPNGYYIIQNKDEAISTIMDLVGRSKSMHDRVEALKGEWNRQNPANTI